MFQFETAVREEAFSRRDPRALVQEKHRIRQEKQIIFGEDIWENPIPEHTAGNAKGLYTVFRDPDGRAFVLSERQLSQHLLLLGSIGSGKTNVFKSILQSLLNKTTPEDLIFIFDTKGDYYDVFYDPRNSHHVVIGNGSRYAGVTRGWNVFGELEDAGGSFGPAGEATAKEIAKQLFKGRESGSQPFFSLAAADLVSKVLIDFERAACASGDRSQLNNAALSSWFNRADMGLYIDMIRRNPDFAGSQLYFGDPARGASQKMTPQALGVFAYINSMCSDLLTGIFAGRAPGGQFSMRRLVRDRGTDGGRTVVFVEYDLSAGEVMGPVYRLLFDLALKEALGQDGRRRGNVILVIDEFKLLPGLIHISDALNFGRSLGVKVIAGLQSIDQIYADYGGEMGDSILSGFSNLFCFRLQDGNSRRFVCDRLGENFYQVNYRSLNESTAFQRAGHTIESWDIMGLGVGQAAVSLAGERPFLFQFPEFEMSHQIL